MYNIKVTDYSLMDNIIGQWIGRQDITFKEITSDQTSFQDYSVPNFVGGIILQPKRDKVIVTREVYSFSEFLNDFGAWA
jgi:hypothetical protein